MSAEILTQITTSKCDKLKFTFHVSMSLETLTLVSKLCPKLINNQPPKILCQLKYWHSFLITNLKNTKFGTQSSVSNEILTQIATNKCEKVEFSFHVSMTLRILTQISTSKCKNAELSFHVSIFREILTQISTGKWC